MWSKDASWAATGISSTDQHRHCLITNLLKCNARNQSNDESYTLIIVSPVQSIIKVSCTEPNLHIPLYSINLDSSDKLLSTFIQKSWDWWKWNHSQMVSFWRGLMLLSIDHHTSIPRSPLLGRSGQRLPSLAGNLAGAQMMMVCSMQGKEPLFRRWHFWLFNSNHWMFHITPFHNVLWQ